MASKGTWDHLNTRKEILEMIKNKKMLITLGVLAILGSIIIAINFSRMGSRAVVYGLFPLTGNVGIVGQYLKNGLSLGCEDTDNTFIGVADDSKADPKTGYTAMQKMIVFNKPKIVLTAISGVAIAIRDMLEKERILHFSMTGTDQLFGKDPKYTYRFYPSASYISDFIVSWFKENKRGANIKHISIVYQNNEWGNSYCEAMRGKIIKLDGRKLDDIYSVDINRDEYINIAARIKTAGSDCLCVSLQGDLCSEFIRRVRLSGYKGLIICDNNFTAAVASKCSDYLDNMVVVDFAKPEGSEFDVFQRKYKHKFNDLPDMPAILVYEVLKIFSVAKSVYGEDAWYDSDKMQAFTYDGMLGQITVTGREIRFPLVVKNAGDLIR